MNETQHYCLKSYRKCMSGMIHLVLIILSFLRYKTNLYPLPAPYATFRFFILGIELAIGFLVLLPFFYIFVLSALYISINIVIIKLLRQKSNIDTRQTNKLLIFPLSLSTLSLFNMHYFTSLCFIKSPLVLLLVPCLKVANSMQGGILHLLSKQDLSISRP